MSKLFAHTIQPFDKKDRQHSFHIIFHGRRWEFFLSIFLLLSQFGRSFFRLIWMVEWSLDYFHKYFDYLNTIVLNMPMTNVVCRWRRREKNTEIRILPLFVLRFVKILTNDSNMSHISLTWWTWTFCIFCLLKRNWSIKSDWRKQQSHKE